jgi:hypothetical protein
MVKFRISTDEKVSKCDNLDIGELQLSAKIRSKIFSVVSKIVSTGGLRIYQGLLWSQPGQRSTSAFSIIIK